MLLVIDLLLGVAAATRAGKFMWEKLFRYYRTNVVPYVITYAGLHVIVAFLPGGVDGALGKALLEGSFAMSVYNMGGSIADNALELGLNELLGPRVSPAPPPSAMPPQ